MIGRAAVSRSNPNPQQTSAIVSAAAEGDVKLLRELLLARQVSIYPYTYIHIYMYIHTYVCMYKDTYIYIDM